MNTPGPVRSCVVCRTRRPQGTLIRMVRTPERITVDRGQHRAAGRGAYLCPADACVRKARQAMRRALGGEVSDDELAVLETEAARRRAARGA